MDTRTFDETVHPRESTGRFATKGTTEAEGGLNALRGDGDDRPLVGGIFPAPPHPGMVPPGTSGAAVRRDGQWLRGRVLDLEISAGRVVRVVADGQMLVATSDEVLVDVDPSEYDGDDVDTVADVFGWSARDWESY
ncbi:hypothetical protein [Oerskovia flava]|uniref:hypothetical protein n=1 Tax=Oerskovia flava TaxID=2986422 RepID=UPI00223EE729|nr:hypothetical protein [Oerskovia sp. JB1-3-2]